MRRSSLRNLTKPPKRRRRLRRMPSRRRNAWPRKLRRSLRDKIRRKRRSNWKLKELRKNDFKKRQSCKLLLTVRELNWRRSRRRLTKQRRRLPRSLSLMRSSARVLDMSSQDSSLQGSQESI